MERPTSDPRRSGRRKALGDPADYAKALDAAIAKSAIGRFPPAAQRELVARGVRMDIPARTIVHGGTDQAVSGVVVRGLMRAFTTAHDGRQLTVFWAREGEWMGFHGITGGQWSGDGQAVTHVVAHIFPAELIRLLATRDSAVAWEIARELSRRLDQAIANINMLAFLDLRGRVSQRLLELALHERTGAPLIARATQQELADAVASPRTSVARVLGDLRAEGIVRSVHGGTLILRPERLAPNAPPLRVA